MHKPSLIRPVPDLTTYLTLALVSAIWGGTFVAGRAMSGELPPMFMASVRFILATAALASILAISKAGFVKIGWSQAIRIAGLGFSGIYAYNIFFFYGLDHTSASRASLIVAINPAVMAIFSCVFLKERVSIVQTRSHRRRGARGASGDHRSQGCGGRALRLEGEGRGCKRCAGCRQYPSGDRYRKRACSGPCRRACGDPKNCSSSVEPCKAVVDDCPCWIACVTASK